MNKIDYSSYIGRKIGRLMILGIGQPVRYGKRQNLTHRFRVRCDCGNEKEMSALNILRRHTKSCGCFGDEIRHSKTGMPRNERGAKSLRWKGCGEVSGLAWYWINKSASYRNIPVTVTLEEISQLFDAQGGKCAISGVELTFESPKTASLDRIDSYKGYETGNVQWVHKDINAMKQKFSMKELLKWAELISNHRKTICSSV